ncbi:heme NO-binding domain-containing protein [Bowmanella sp. JS7-9]|uniref:Heme NO-binding domain-containing protein n=1 Tax=Pseudobowmanella zhangzhouensis TaxID=1537679 RepID=A0ABW1XKG6_9ALTE|nr:heme NO-binding domain-containing protein [Bowmanella sp. JS7-9]TBX20601.1 hypothetical protein TK45_14960 [Bowmanella sp. JS7-9]
MKGLVFTEFMSLVESTWGEDMVDDLIDEVNPPSGGAYTTVATYTYEELVSLVSALSEKTGIPVPQLVHTFGRYLGPRFASKFPLFFTTSPDLFDLLKKIDNHIHVEVRKLYPDAELPHFSFEQSQPDLLTMHYRSSRHLGDLAHGLIEACAEYYQTPIHIERQQHACDDGAHETFQVRRL